MRRLKKFESWDDVEDQIKYNKREFDRNDKEYQNDKEISYFINKYKKLSDADIITVADNVFNKPKRNPSEYLALTHIASERGLHIDGIQGIDINNEVSDKEYSYMNKLNQKGYLESTNNNFNKIKSFNDFKYESVGEYETSFTDINIDETELEDSDKPNLGKLKQKDGKEIIETTSKTDAYNAKRRLGGDVIQEPGFSDKQIHHVNKISK